MIETVDAGGRAKEKLLQQRNQRPDSGRRFIALFYKLIAVWGKRKKRSLTRQQESRAISDCTYYN